MRKYFLFFREQQNKSILPIINLENDDLEIHKFRIGEKGRIYIYGEKISVKVMLVRLIFAIITFGKTYIYYCTNKMGEIVHTSCVVPKCIKFPFLSKNDYEIGPCFTIPKYRGKGIYPKVLDYIVSTFETGGGAPSFI